MKVHAFGLFLLFSALAAFANQTAAQPTKESDEELAKKIQRLRDQLEPLIQEQQNRADKLVEQQRLEAQRKAREEAERRAKEEAAKKQAEAERQAKEAVEKKKHVAKVEIRGLLGKGPEAVGLGYAQAWHVTVNELKWRLDFGDNKELAAEAAKLAGKPIVITGTVANVKKGPFIPKMPPAAYPQPMSLQANPYLLPHQPMYFPTPIIISVDSLKAARD